MVPGWVERARDPRLSRDMLIDISLAAAAAVASAASLLAYGRGGWSVATTAWAVASALVLIGLRRAVLGRDPALGSVCATVAVWVFTTTFAWFAYGITGYAPPSLGDATAADVVLFPLVLGAAFTGGFAYLLSKRRTQASHVNRAFVSIAIECSAIAAFVMAAIASLIGLSTVLMIPLAAGRLAKAEGRLHVGLSAAELCHQYPYRTENACNPPSRWLHEKGLPGLSIHFVSAGMFCADNGTDLDVSFSSRETVTSWKRTDSGSAC